MTDTLDAPAVPYGPWNPGIESVIPDGIQHLASFLRPENVFTSVAAAIELRDLTGLDLADVVAFRPERLALHEVLIRVTADLSVPDGSRIEDLGINFRQMTRRLLAQCVEPRMTTVTDAYEALRRRIAASVAREAGPNCSRTSRTVALPSRCVAVTVPCKLLGAGGITPNSQCST